MLLPPTCVSLMPATLDRLMPLHLRVGETGRIVSTGPTLAKLFPGGAMVGADLFEVFLIRRLARLASPDDLRRHAGEQLHLALLGPDRTETFRGLALPLADDPGMLINLSFGISVVDAVRLHGLTQADFAPTDLAIEMLYVVEAKTAMMGAWMDVSLREHGSKVAAEERAMTDPLTGLRNRRAMDLCLADATRSGTAFGLMHLDLDFFKAVNDTLGHAAGDHVLQSVAQVLRAETRASDTVARVGGDEFVIMLPGLSDPAILANIARRMIDRLTQPFSYAGQSCRVSASIGVTVSTLYDHPDAARMLSDADRALYASKHAGRAQARFHEPPDMARTG